MERLISLFGPLVMTVLVFASVCPLLRKSLARIPIMFHGYGSEDVANVMYGNWHRFYISYLPQ